MPQKDDILWLYSAIDMKIVRVKFVKINPSDQWWRVQAVDFSAQLSEGDFYSNEPGTFFTSKAGCFAAVIEKLIKRNEPIVPTEEARQEQKQESQA